MTARRKTLLANELPVSFDDDEAIDDEISEKRRRISVYDNVPGSIRRKRPTVNEGNETPTANPNNRTVTNNNPTVNTPALPKPSNEQLSCLYNNCVKLLNENKINVKNAFQLKLIDYMSDIVLNENIVGGVTNFQVVGCTIDVGTKIYAARVDALHQNTYQMLSGLGNNNNNDSDETGSNTLNDNDGGDNEENNEEDNPHKKQKTKKRRAIRSCFIAENLESITTKLRDDFKDEDMYFTKISTCIESEAISGILTNKIHFADDSLKLLVNSEDKIHECIKHGAKFCNEGVEMSFNHLYDMYKSNNIDFKNLNLCSDLNNFRFIGWNLEANDEISKLVESMAHESDDEEMRFDANLHRSMLNISDNGPMEMGADLYDDHDMINDQNENPLLGNSGLNLEQHQSNLDVLSKIDDIRSLSNVSELTHLISQSASDYSYFNLDKLKIHDLPKHLKQIASRLIKDSINSDNSKSVASSSVAKGTVARNRKEPPKMDFHKTVDFSKYFKQTKKAIYLCDRTIEKRSEKPARFETERQYDYKSKEFFQPNFKAVSAQLFSDAESVENLLLDDNLCKSDHHDKQEAPRTQANMDMDYDDGHMGGVDDDFEIPGTAGTAQPFFSQNGGEFGHTQANEVEMPIMSEAGALIERFDDGNLVEMPLQVNALNIEYAKTSKNIDVRKLKQVIWSLISSDNNKENQEGPNDTTLDETISKRLNTTGSIRASLKDVYSQLKPPLITQRVYDDLSICIVFQMLLFLANEHGLILKHDPNGTDIGITNYC